jgi:hypothetical protein
MWRYSLLGKPEPLLSKDMKMKIYSVARFYSETGNDADHRTEDKNIFGNQPCGNPHVSGSGLLSGIKYIVNNLVNCALRSVDIVFM